jgi:HEAT repeat protein
VARGFDEKLAALRTLDVTSPKAHDQLRAALASKNGLLAAAAAKLIGEHRVESATSLLAPAFEQLCEDPVKRDPGCRGKLAIARALHALDVWEERVFVRGLHVEQPEGFQPEDTAAPVRAVCGLAHAHLLRPDALDVLAVLLADRHRTARAAAAQGIGDVGRSDGGSLLRFKILSGPDEPEVISACLDSLMSLQRESGIDFAIGLLAAHDDTAEVAAIALGSTRDPRCLEPLLAYCDGCVPAVRHRAGFLALALLRSDQAIAHLLDAIRTKPRADAVAAARALATFKDVPAISEQLREAAAAQRDSTLRREIIALLA